MDQAFLNLIQNHIRKLKCFELTVLFHLLAKGGYENRQLILKANSVEESKNRAQNELSANHLKIK